jgi:hypothetical protein
MPAGTASQGPGAKVGRAAIVIEAQRHNAHKNLGIALAGQGDFPEAARCFIQATKLNAAAPRPTAHLKDLLTQQPQLTEQFRGELEMCEKAIKIARDAAVQAMAGRNA